jgi:hypothetical protein
MVRISETKIGIAKFVGGVLAVQSGKGRGMVSQPVRWDGARAGLYLPSIDQSTSCKYPLSFCPAIPIPRNILKMSIFQRLIHTTRYSAFRPFNSSPLWIVQQGSLTCSSFTVEFSVKNTGNGHPYNNLRDVDMSRPGHCSIPCCVTFELSLIRNTLPGLVRDVSATRPAFCPEQVLNVEGSQTDILLRYHFLSKVWPDPRS